MLSNLWLPFSLLSLIQGHRQRRTMVELPSKLGFLLDTVLRYAQGVSQQDG